MADLSSDLFKQLAYFALGPGVQRARKPSDYEIALQIMQNTRGKTDFSGVWSPALAGNVTKPKPKDDGQSTFGRIVDIVSRPLYGTANVLKSQLGHAAEGDIDVKDMLGLSGAGVALNIGDFARGFSGKDKTTTRDITKEIESKGVNVPDAIQKGPGGFAFNLAGDIALDPLSFVPIGGTAKLATKGAYKAVGKEAPYWTLPKSVKQMHKREQLGTPRLTDAPVIAPSNWTPKAFQAIQDAPIVNAALEQGSRDAAIAERILSPQQAALHGAEFNREAGSIMRAAEASPEAQKTYRDLMSQITFKSRGAPQNAIDRNANRLTIPMNSSLKIRNKGRFIAKGTPLPTAGIEGIRRATSSGGGIFSRETAHVAAKRATTPKISGVFGPVNTAVSKALKEAEGIPITKLKPGQTISERDVVHGVMSRFATHMGQKDLRPLVLDHMASALARAGERTRVMEAAFKGYKDDEILEAWDIARNAKPRGVAQYETSGKLADILTGQMEQFFRSRAVPENFAKGNSVAMRTGMSMKDINRTLARYNVPFKFTNGVATDPVTHSPISYEKGTNWLISWETHAPKNTTELKRFIFGLQSAAEQLTAEYSFLDDVAYRMGSRGKTATKNVKIDHPRLGDYYFDKEIADQLSTALKTMGEAYSPKSPFTRFIRQAVSKWKTGVTIYNPRHHVANVIGDTFLMWMAGINDPRVFSKSAKVMFANKGLYKDLTSVEKLVGGNAVKDALAKPGTIVAKNKNGFGLTAEQVYIGAFNHGLLQRAGIVEDIAREGIPLPGRLAKPLGGKIHGFFAGAAETREHYVKLAHFIGAIEKSSGKNARQIMEDAAHEVRKWHPDGLDLTKQEQAIRALGIPFYSWMRKSTPLIIEGALMHPQKAFTSYAKVNYNLQNSLGIEGTSLSDPYPDDQLFPHWLKDDNVPVLGKTGMPGLPGFLAGLGRQAQDDQGNPIDAYTLGGPTNPVQDFFTQFGGLKSFGETKDAALSSVNPMFRIPLELQQGKELYTHIPIKDRKADYFTNQIPLVNQAARMTNVGPFGPTGRAEKYGTGLQGEQTLNWVTGLNVTGTGPYIKSAEFERLPEVRKENEKIREFSASIGYPLKDKGRIPQWIRDLYDQRKGAQ